MFGALLADLTKAFDCLNHDLWIAKLNEYGFSLPAIRLTHNYLLNRKQRTRIVQYKQFVQHMDGNCFAGTSRINTWSPFVQHFPCRCLFFIVNSTDIANYANDNTPHATANDIDSLIASLEESLKSLFTWFDNNLMKSNADNYHLLVSSNEKVTK